MWQSTIKVYMVKLLHVQMLVVRMLNSTSKGSNLFQEEVISVMKFIYTLTFKRELIMADLVKYKSNEGLCGKSFLWSITFTSISSLLLTNQISFTDE